MGGWEYWAKRDVRDTGTLGILEHGDAEGVRDVGILGVLGLGDPGLIVPSHSAPGWRQQWQRLRSAGSWH